MNGSNDLVVDRIVKRRFPAGAVEIPPHDGTNGTGYGVPHLALIREEPIAEPTNPKTPDELRAAWLKGETLSNGALEARVIGHPYLRLTGLRRPGERDWLRPALQALKHGQIESLQVRAPGNSHSIELTLTRYALLRFWRRPAPLTSLAIANE